MCCINILCVALSAFFALSASVALCSLLTFSTLFSSFLLSVFAAPSSFLALTLKCLPCEDIFLLAVLSVVASHLFLSFFTASLLASVTTCIVLTLRLSGTAHRVAILKTDGLIGR